MPTPKRATTLLRRTELAARLLDGAERQIAAGGLASLRARTLADAAGCSVGAIYGAFPDLDELVLQVNRRTLDAMGAALRGAVDAAAPPGAQLVALATAYAGFAAANRQRWEALFAHRMAGGRLVPGWYAECRAAAFAPALGPLASLRPHGTEADRATLARSLFAAVHGVVSLGLDELLGPMDPDTLRRQLREVTEALVRGLEHNPIETDRLAP